MNAHYPSLRDMFAMAALQGLISEDAPVEITAGYAYQYADAMMRAMMNNVTQTPRASCEECNDTGYGISDDIEGMVSCPHCAAGAAPAPAQQPASAEVGRDWRRHFTAEIVLDPPFPYGVAVITNSDGEQSVHTHGDDPVLWHFIAAMAASSGRNGGAE